MSKVILIGQLMTLNIFWWYDFLVTTFVEKHIHSPSLSSLLSTLLTSLVTLNWANGNFCNPLLEGGYNSCPENIELLTLRVLSKWCCTSSLLLVWGTYLNVLFLDVAVAIIYTKLMLILKTLMCLGGPFERP